MNRYGEPYSYIQTQTKANDSIGYYWTFSSYFLYGENLDRKVYFLPPDEDNYETWLNHLRQRNIRIFAIGPIPPALPKPNQVLDWIKSHNEQFILVVGQDPTRELVFYQFRNLPNPS